ncbi:MAG: glycosyltransferase family 4 protein [Pyrinomonadaceae bacterium]
MRILQLSSARTLGGGERHLIDLARGLSARGHEVHAALVPESPLLAELSGVLPARNIHAFQLRNSLDVVSAVRLARLLGDEGIRIVHAHMARDYPLAALAARRTPAARLVITRHVLFPLSRVHRLALSNVARVIAVSAAVADALRAQNIFPVGKIRVVTNAIDVERFEHAAHVADRDSLRRDLQMRALCVVGSVGELSPLKGHADFVRAAAGVLQTHDRAVEFVIVGEDASRDGRHRASLEKLISESGMNERVRLLGRCADVARILPALDVFVSASHSEAFGLATAEAMACGVPVVTTATAGAGEIIEDGVNGRIVEVGDAGALAEAINELLGDARLRHSLATRARLTARERFSLERMIAQTERVYEEALEIE